MKLSAFLAVDVQNGFITEKQELPVPGAAEVIPIINKMLPRFAVTIASQDWHPADHGSFASNNPGKRPFATGMLGSVQQVFWPDHCIQGTRGAAFHPDFDERRVRAIFRKGTDPAVDSYSAFADNAGKNPTGLDGYLRGLGVRDLFIAGLALDYCVRFTALDARRLLPDLRVTVVQDACRAVDPRTGEEAKRALRQQGVRLITAGEMDL
ncbi:MAG: bifunctional nicotinamidase/pyrazinamidase [Acidobacteriota bacterium]